MSSFTPTGGSGGIPIQVTPGTTGQVVSVYSEALAVAIAGTATILQYTVPPGVSGYLLNLEISGTNIATYDVLLNSAQFARYRTWFSGPFIIDTKLGSGLADSPKLASGDILEINVTNFRPYTGDFEARLQVLEA